MYLITAIFKKNSLDDVLQELYEREIEGVTVSNVIGKGGLSFIKNKNNIDLDEKIRVDIVVSNDTFKESAKEAIRVNTQDIGHGSGKIWVTPVLEVERVRTGEKNELALKKSKVATHSNLQKNHYESTDTPVS